MKYDKIVIGVDESYTRTGISIAADGKLLHITSLSYRGCKCKTSKRRAITLAINKLCVQAQRRASEVVIIVERIRHFSKGFMSINYIKATGALIACIVDAAEQYNIPVYSVDTRAWKSAIVGTSKGGKAPTQKFIKQLTGVQYNDDAADSAAIALYGFIKSPKLKLET